MRHTLTGCTALALVLAGCSKAPDASDAGDVGRIAQDRDDATPAAPDIALSAAPGVAFTYRYGFRLPPRAIAGAQEAHAAACEKLGVARCRITAMDYRVSGENAIRGSLNVALDPAIARAFGKQAVDLVQAAKGTLVGATITGTDAAATVDRAVAAREAATAAVRRADARLAQAGTRSAERAALEGGRAAAAASARVAAATAADARDSLATTPMRFDYDSGDAIRGFDSSAPLTSALDTLVGSAQVTLAILLGIIAIGGPPVIVLAILLLLWRRLRGPIRRWGAGDDGSPAG